MIEDDSITPYFEEQARGDDGSLRPKQLRTEHVRARARTEAPVESSLRLQQFSGRPNVQAETGEVARIAYHASESILARKPSFSLNAAIAEREESADTSATEQHGAKKRGLHLDFLFGRRSQSPPT
jgi:hypothetical protein